MIDKGNCLDGVNKETCGHCNKKRTPEGCDGCIGELKGVANACCGHGETKCAYVQFFHDEYNEIPNGKRLSGQDALNYIRLSKLTSSELSDEKTKLTHRMELSIQKSKNQYGENNSRTWQNDDQEGRFFDPTK